MTILEIYKKVQKGEKTKSFFLEQVRKDPSLKQWITPLLSYNDIIQILKNKNILFENTEDSEERKKSRTYSKNPAWDAHNRLEKGDNENDFVGKSMDKAMLSYYTGQGKDAQRPKNAFSLNEDPTTFKQALQDIKQQILQKEQEEGGVDADFVHDLIGIAVGEYGLDNSEEKNLSVDIFDWRNSTQNGGGTDAIDEIISLNEAKKIKKTNKLKGGKGDKLNPDMVNYGELRAGIRIEMEHTDDPEKAQEIALDHLAEFPDYYTRLKVMEKKAMKSQKKKRTDLSKEVNNDFVDKDNQMKPVKVTKKEKLKEIITVGSGGERRINPENIVNIKDKLLHKFWSMDKLDPKVFILFRNILSQYKIGPFLGESSSIDRLTSNQLRKLYEELSEFSRANFNIHESKKQKVKRVLDKLIKECLSEIDNYKPHICSCQKKQNPLKEQDNQKEDKQLNIGSNFTMQGDLGKFRKGEKVKITNKKNLGEDVELTIENEQGTKDIFYIDPNDDLNMAAE